LASSIILPLSVLFIKGFFSVMSAQYLSHYILPASSLDDLDVQAYGRRAFMFHSPALPTRALRAGRPFDRVPSCMPGRGAEASS
jgi:hypothetical protein